MNDYYSCIYFGTPILYKFVYIGLMNVYKVTVFVYVGNASL